jgi:hypothetical protein
MLCSVSLRVLKRGIEFTGLGASRHPMRQAGDGVAPGVPARVKFIGGKGSENLAVLLNLLVLARISVNLPPFCRLSQGSKYRKA